MKSLSRLALTCMVLDMRSQDSWDLLVIWLNLGELPMKGHTNYSTLALLAFW